MTKPIDLDSSIKLKVLNEMKKRKAKHDKGIAILIFSTIFYFICSVVFFCISIYNHVNNTTCCEPWYVCISAISLIFCIINIYVLIDKEIL